MRKSSKPAAPAPLTALLPLLLLVSAGLNLYLLSRPSPENDLVLASVGSETLRRSSVPQNLAQKLERMEAALEEERTAIAEEWIAARILPKEAASRSMSPSQLLEMEVGKKVRISPQDVHRQYVRSAAAELLAWPGVMQQIGKEMEDVQKARYKREFFRGLYPKYQVQLERIVPPADDELSLPSFPAYVPPSAGPDLAEGRVQLPPSRGPLDAPVVMEVFSDTLCPYSHRFHPTLEELQERFPRELRLVARHFPLPFHEGAHLMAQATVCAQEQGTFWEMQDRLITGEPAKKDAAALTEMARELGLDTGRFQDCLASSKYAAWVEQDMEYGQQNGIQGTPGFLINGRKGFGAMPLESLIPLVEWHLKPEGRYPGSVPPAQQNRPGMEPNKVVTFPPDVLKGAPSYGPAKAPATVVEFVDYHCPFCQKGAATLNELMSRNPGKVRLVSMNLPLPMHANAFKAAEAALCADEQGKFWEYRQEIFGPSWGKQTPEDLKAAAKKAGLKAPRFNECLDSGKQKARVQKDMEAAKAFGVQSTPMYFVNGRPVHGAQPVENFEKAMQSK